MLSIIAGTYSTYRMQNVYIRPEESLLGVRVRREISSLEDDRELLVFFYQALYSPCYNCIHFIEGKMRPINYVAGQGSFLYKVKDSGYIS